jgi:4-diphosphocytidyl-2-C-methyl-D-erythritol kinase
MVILSPEIDMPNKTAAMYGRLTPSEYTSGALTRKLEGRIRGKSDIPPQLLFNVFDNVAFDAFPALSEYRDRLHALGAREIHLAGSGPSMFALVSRREVGTAIQLLLTSINGWKAFLTQPYRAEVVA